MYQQQELISLRMNAKKKTPKELRTLAICRDYGALMAALVARRNELGYTQMDLDARAGLQEGHSSKLENWQSGRYGRGLGALTLPLVLEALDVALVIVEAPKGRLPTQEEIEIKAELLELLPSYFEGFKRTLSMVKETNEDVRKALTRKRRRDRRHAAKRIGASASSRMRSQQQRRHKPSGSGAKPKQ